MIPFGAFEPDRSPFAVDASDLTKNCLPVSDGWAPKPDISEISDALPSQCLGAIYVRNSSGAFTIIAGTATKLYKLNTTDYSWTDITRLSGGDYAVPQGDRWSFAVFGNNLIAVNIANEPQVYDIDAGSNFANLAGSPPKAKYVWAAGGFLVLGHLVNFPSRIQWSGYEDIEYWSVGLDKFADLQDLNDGGEDVMGGVGFENGAYIFQRKKIKAMTFGGDTTFGMRITDVNSGRGAISPLSIAYVGPGNVFFLSEDGFMQGVEGNPIGEEKVDRWILDDVVDRDLLPEVRGVADPYRKIVWWQIPQSDGTKILLGYRWTLQRWCYADNNVTEMAVVTSPGITWDGLDALYATIDDVSAPFDARIFAGGRPEFAGFTTDHKLGFFSGGAMAARLRTARVEPFQGERAWCDNIRLVTDASIASCTLTIGAAGHHQESITQGSGLSGSTRTGLFNTRRTGRLFDFQLDIAAGATWTTATGVRPEFVREGRL